MRQITLDKPNLQAPDAVPTIMYYFPPAEYELIWLADEQQNGRDVHVIKASTGRCETRAFWNVEVEMIRGIPEARTTLLVL